MLRLTTQRLKTTNEDRLYDSREALERKKIILGLAFTFLFCIYLIMHSNIRKESIDDAWVLNWFYNYIYYGKEIDIAYMVGTKPVSGITIFAKLQGIVYGVILDRIGWTLSNAFWISKFFVLVSIFFWYKIFISLNISKFHAALGVLLMAVLEPFVFAGNCARGEALCLLFVTLSLYFFIQQFYILSGIMVMLAFETHIMGFVTGGIYISAYFISNIQYYLKNRKQTLIKLGKFLLGIFIGLCLYLILHKNSIDLIFNMEAAREIATYSGSLTDNFIFSYFFEEKFMRHLPELIIILMAIGLCIYKRLYKNNKFAGILLILIFILPFFTKRESAPYIIYIYPAFMITIILAIKNLKRELALLVLFICLLTPQYIYAYHIYSPYNIDHYVEKLQSAITDRRYPIMGNANSWFAFQGDQWYEYTSIGYGIIDSKKIYIIENKNYIQYTEGRQEQWNKIMKTYPSNIIDSFEVNGEQINIRVHERI